MKDGEWRAVVPRSVLACEVVEELVGGDLREEVVSGSEVFDVEELGLYSSVHGFDVCVCVAASGWDVGMGCSCEGLDCVDEAG